MGGVGSGNWYRFDKKNTTGECHWVDVRYLHREGLLVPRHRFSLRCSWCLAMGGPGFGLRLIYPVLPDAAVRRL